MPDPLITIVTVVFNGEEYLGKTIRSVAEQTYTNKEYIVIDGGSSDRTLDIVRSYKQHIDYWISEPDRGIYDAMNKGINSANGEWIVFMNAGDIFFDHQTVEKARCFLHKDALIVYGDALISRKEQLLLQNQRNRHMDVRKSIIHQSMFIKTWYLKKDPYSLEYPIMADYDNLLKISLKEPEKILYIPQVTCIYDGTGISSNPLYQYIGEYERVARKHFRKKDFLKFQFYIIPRMIYSLRLMFPFFK